MNQRLDFSIGKGGSINDFGIQYYDYSICNLVQKIAHHFSFPPVIYDLNRSMQEAAARKIKVLPNFMISSFPAAVSARKDTFAATAEQFFREVCFELNGKMYYDIGFKNDAFERFFDVLSFITYSRNNPFKREEYLVLNSISFFEKSQPFMERHEVIWLYLDCDTIRQNFSRNSLAINKQYIDESSLFSGIKI